MSDQGFYTFEHAQRLPGAFHLDTRMSAVLIAPGKLALISPIPIDDALAAQLATLGQVEILIAPNLLHHLYLADACRRYPRARVLGPPALRAKRPDLTLHATLDQRLPDELSAALDVVRIDGAPKADEFAFFHRASRTLIVTDLVFHVRRPRGFVANVVLLLEGVRGRLAPSPVWRFMIKDRARTRASVARLLELPFETLVMAHGEIVREQARARLAQALSWMLKTPKLLPAAVT
jgi:hypothetical protein